MVKLIVIDRPIQPVSYSCVKDNYVGPQLVGRTKLEYDHGKFRETQYSTDGRAITISTFDGNLDRMSYRYAPIAHSKGVGLDLESYLYSMAKNSPEKYFRFNKMPPASVITVSGPICSTIHKVSSDVLMKFKKLGQEIIAGKQCTVYAAGASETMKVWDNWVLEEDVAGGPHSKVTSLKFVERLPPATFQLPKGFYISAPRFAKAKPLPGHKVIEFQDPLDDPVSKK